MSSRETRIDDRVQSSLLLIRGWTNGRQVARGYQPNVTTQSTKLLRKVTSSHSYSILDHCQPIPPAVVNKLRYVLDWAGHYAHIHHSHLSSNQLEAVLSIVKVTKLPVKSCNNRVACTLLAVTFAEIPSYIKICSRNDPEINKCVLNSIEQLRSKLATGIPELDVPPIEPLLLKHVRLLRGPQAARLDFNLTNIEIFGPSTFKIRDFNIDPNEVNLTFKVGFQKLDFRGKYKINAQILLLKLVGEGGLTGSFFGYECDCLLKSHKIVKNNDTYINFEKMKFDIKINKAAINLDNLFGGDPVLGPVSNQILNANSDLFIDEIKPVLEDSLSDLFTNIANKITREFTYNDLFPNN